MRTSILLALVVVCAMAAGADPEIGRDAWAADWNARVDAHARLRDHPCGDYAFDPWADSFLAGCQGEEAGNRSKAECKERNAWVWERSRQCNTWQSWLLRNHHKHKRSKSKEPQTRVK
ncbi:MAG: hypothetical protein GY723_14460 [bacterium]|nr:hypothetical protein [bacterium]MCP5065143.1 hypothetical protein [bacterium]